MPINQSHLRKLQEGLQVHNMRIDELRKQIVFQDDEIGAHSIIVGLGTNITAMKLLGRLIDDPTFMGSIQGREIEFLEGEGITLPSDSRIELNRKNNGSIIVDIYVRSGGYPFRITWDSQLGFSATPES